MGIRQALLSTAFQGGFVFVTFGTVGLGFWYGATLVYNMEYTGGMVIQVTEILA